jgi:hypothetical protein
VSGVLARARAALARGGRSLRREWYRELRRHAGDASLPAPLRVRLRERAQRGLARLEAGRAATAETTD